MGEADGVSAWAEDGIDAGEYSRVLMQFASEAVQDSHGVVDARQVGCCTCLPGPDRWSNAVLEPGTCIACVHRLAGGWHEIRST
jgi:hypothetical protein